MPGFVSEYAIILGSSGFRLISMNMEVLVNTTNLLDAIQVVKENEKNATEKYAEAAKGLVNPLARELFVQLSEFERFHLAKLTALEKSLQESGKYIQYKGRTFPLPPVFEIKAAEEPDKKSVMKIVSEAMELEKQAQETYASLAGECPDQEGMDMFNKLSSEEKIHLKILSEAYWSLNDSGTWKWSRPEA
jgi:rubrerythrin